MGHFLFGNAVRAATERDLEPYERMRQQQAHQLVPVLYHRKGVHERLLIALFDGTGQDANDPRQLPTSIGELRTQAHKSITYGARFA
jgi:hypothetical protein